MSETDRQKLERLAQENEAGRIARQHEEAVADDAAKQRQAERDAEDRQKTKEILAQFKQTFQGFRLVPTNHEVCVDTAPCSRLHYNAEDDGFEYVALTISHCGVETGHFQGRIPLLLARCRNSKFELHEFDKQTSNFANLDELKNAAVEAVAGLGKDSILRIFAAIHSLH